MSITLENKKASLHAAIEKMSALKLDLLEHLVTQVASSEEIDAIFLTRATKALLALASIVPVEKATAASSDYDLFLTLLQQPEVMAVLPSSDPLASAKIRGIIAKRELLKAEGGCISSKEVEKILGIKRQAIDKRRLNAKLIGLLAGRVYLYPAWQFVNGKTLPGLEQVLENLSVSDPWMQTSWMLNGNSRLQGKRPLDMLREGNLHAVLDAANLYGEQGAA